jgi:hypothetical protein
LTKTVLDFQKALNEKIDLTLDGIRVSFQKAMALKQTSKAEVEDNLSDLSEKLVSIANLGEELSGMSAVIGYASEAGSRSAHPA